MHSMVHLLYGVPCAIGWYTFFDCFSLGALLQCQAFGKNWTWCWEHWDHTLFCMEVGSLTIINIKGQANGKRAVLCSTVSFFYGPPI